LARYASERIPSDKAARAFGGATGNLPLRSDVASLSQAPQCMCYFDVEQMRRMQPDWLATGRDGLVYLPFEHESGSRIVRLAPVR
jgi:hypothetical protein